MSEQCLVPFGWFPRFGGVEEALPDSERFAGELALALERVAAGVADARLLAQQFGESPEPVIGLAEFSSRDLFLLAGAAEAADMPSFAVLMELLRLPADDDTRVLICRLRLARDAADQQALTGREKLAAVRYLNRVGATTWYGSEQDFRRAVKDREPDALVRLAEALTGEGRIAEAEQTFRDAVDTGDSRAVEKFAWWLDHHGRLDEAMEMLHEQGELEVRASMAEARNFTAAIVENAHREAIGADPDALFRYSIWLRKQGRADEAEVIMRASVENPSGIDVIMEFGFWLDGQGRLDEAEEFYRVAAKAGEPDAWHALGSLLNARGHRAEAEQAFLEAIAMGSPDALQAYNQFLGVS